MIRNRLSEHMGQRRITAVELAQRTGLSRNTIGALYNEKAKGIEFETLARLCKALNAQPGDILVYAPAEEEGE